MLTAELLSRIQFAFTISFHIIFPAFSIGLATFLLIMETLWLITKKALYLSICKFWLKVFALTFGMGVISGIVMEFQLGTNWSGYTHAAGPVLGSLFTYEVLTAFFIEAGFLGVMIFGWNRVPPVLHYLATLLVAFGVTLSGFWILSANSWMQAPAGAVLEQGHFVVNDWWQVIFNPMVGPRYLHMMLAAYLTTLFVIAGVAAYYLLKKQHTAFSKKCFSFATWGILILIIAQFLAGDGVGLDVHKHQPIKTAAIEGVWNTQKGAPLLLFAVPDQQQARNLFSLGIPYGASLINTHKLDGEIQGLKSVPAEDRPYVPLVFYSFRLMVGIGVLMLGIALVGLYLRWRKRLFDRPWFLKTCILASPLGFIAIVAGWFTAETGRQPWVVYGLLRTSEAASQVSVGEVLTSLIVLILIYALIFGIFYFRYLTRIIKAGPAATVPVEQPFAYMHQPEKEIN
jgi:cytochrome d ubiquinol oxidase subunit I